MISGLAWECSCGKIEYSEETPDECSKCGSLDGFMQIPAEVLKNREEMGLDEEEIEEKPVKLSKLKAKVAKGRKKK